MKVKELNKINNIGKIGIKETCLFEKRSGIPIKFKSPKLKIGRI